MNRQKRNRVAFRPMADDAKLEDRVVLASGATLIQTPPPLIDQITPAASPFSPLTRLTAAQVRQDFLSAFRSTSNALRTAIRSDMNQLFANGQPTAQQVADFNANVAGQINAAAFRTASQLSLLPGTGSQLATNFQNALLGNSPTSLLNRIATRSFAATASSQLGTPVFANSGRALQFAVNNVLNRATQLGTGALNNFFNTTNLNRLSVNSTGQRIPLQQFFGNQIMAQAGNTFGSLANSFGNQANNLFFQNNGVAPTTSAINSFNNSFGSALNTAAFQLAGNLGLFRGGNGLNSSIQSGLFGTRNNALFNSVTGLPTTSATDFATGLTSAFNTGFGNIAPSLTSFFGTNPSNGSIALPTSNFSNVFNPAFTGNTFNSGFNNGFGSGFIGFGTAPTTFNSNFGTGFNNFVTTANQGTGIFFPGALGSGSGVGAGIGNGSRPLF